MNRLKNSKALSLLLVALIYVAAFYAGIGGFVFFADAHILLRLLACDVIATVIVYIAGVVLNNSSVYDPYWSVKPIVFCVLLMFYFNNTSAAAILTLAVVSVWGVRLTYNWITTFDNLYWQDWRYTKFKAEHRYLWQIINFFGINLIPTLVVFCACIPIVFVLEGSFAVNVFTVAAAALAVGAVYVQHLSDMAMHSFLKDKSNSGKVCREGLWKYSRHPNYFAEISFWWLIYLMALSMDFSHWFLFGGGVAVTLLFEFISIPLAEKRHSQRRADYAGYIKSTGRILPIPRRKNENT